MAFVRFKCGRKERQNDGQSDSVLLFRRHFNRAININTGNCKMLNHISMRFTTPSTGRLMPHPSSPPPMSQSSPLSGQAFVFGLHVAPRSGEHDRRPMSGIAAAGRENKSTGWVRRYSRGQNEIKTRVSRRMLFPSSFSDRQPCHRGSPLVPNPVAGNAICTTVCV